MKPKQKKIKKRMGEGIEKVPVKEVRHPIIIGPHPLERDESGELLNMSGNVFPSYNGIIMGKGPHGFLAFEFARQQHLNSDDVRRDSVPLIVTGEGIIQVRPEIKEGKMDNALRAVQFLQSPPLSIPGDKICYAGELSPNKYQLIKSVGELWRVNPPASTHEEMVREIKNRIVGERDGFKNEYYYNHGIGERYLTCSLLERVGDSIDNIGEFHQRLEEIVNLYKQKNTMGYRELDFYRVDGSKFTIRDVERVLQAARTGKSTDVLENDFRNMLVKYRRATDYEARTDDFDNLVWVTQMYRELRNIEVSEEERFRMSPEFWAQVKWLPGARIVTNGMKRFEFDPLAEERTIGFLEGFLLMFPDLEYINLGELTHSLKKGEKLDPKEIREVYIAELKTEGEDEQVFFIRRRVCDSETYFPGLDADEALRKDREYIRYNHNVLRGIQALGIPATGSEELRPIDVAIEVPDPQNPEEKIQLSCGFFARPYIDALASDKVPESEFGNGDFTLEFARVMGEAAADNMLIGRASAFTGHRIFGVGDELIIYHKPFFHKDKRPDDIFLADVTGAFNNTKSWGEIQSNLDHEVSEYVSDLDRILEIASNQGLTGERFQSRVIGTYLAGMRKRFDHRKKIISDKKGTSDDLYQLFSDLTPEQDVVDEEHRWGGIRDGYKRILERAEELEPDIVIRAVEDQLST